MGTAFAGSSPGIGEVSIIADTASRRLSSTADDRTSPLFEIRLRLSEELPFPHAGCVDICRFVSLNVRLPFPAILWNCIRAERRFPK